MDTNGICGVSENIEKNWQTRERQRERERETDRQTDREIDDDENIIWLKIDANFLLDFKDKNSGIYCTLPWSNKNKKLRAKFN